MGVAGRITGAPGCAAAGQVARYPALRARGIGSRHSRRPRPAVTARPRVPGDRPASERRRRAVATEHQCAQLAAAVGQVGGAGARAAPYPGAEAHRLAYRDVHVRQVGEVAPGGSGYVAAAALGVKRGPRRAAVDALYQVGADVDRRCRVPANARST